jgi:oxygen-independent coproporphyrinogen-3 oxidase
MSPAPAAAPPAATTAARGHGGAGPAAADLRAYQVPAGTDPLAAFARRAPVMPWRSSRPVAAAEAAELTRTLFASPRRERSVAYVHIPYCHNHCLFCGFYQNPWRAEASADFADTLIAEIATAARQRLVADGPALAAVYLGGGTPTALAGDDIARLIGALRRHLPLAADCEITLEGRLHDFNRAKAQAAVAAGVNRISIGVQSFDTQVRRRLGRKASRDEAVAKLAELAALDAVALIIDLMYGLPGQDPACWARDVDTGATLPLDGLDVYALNVWPNGPLAQAIAGGKTLPLPTLPDQARAYVEAGRTLRARGWRQFSHAHYARTDLERNVYNHSVKAGADCLAFGPGAGGQAHGLRWRNTSDLGLWRARVAEGAPPIGDFARSAEGDQAQTLVVAGLEAGRLDCARVEAVAPGFRAAAAGLLANWCAAGLADFDGDHLALNPAGWFWMTTLTAGLHAALDQAALAAAAAAPARPG